MYWFSSVAPNPGASLVWIGFSTYEQAEQSRQFNEDNGNTTTGVVEDI